MKSRDRFQEIIRVFISYGFGYLIDSKFNNSKKSPINLRMALEELGPTFIKIGQILSTRPDLLPEEYINELIKLQDSAPEESFENIKSVFEESINKKIYDCFLYFSKKPTASASIAQVHEAILNDGRAVIVKIQRPNIYNTMKTDIDIIKKIIKLSKGRIDIDIVDPLAVIEELESTTEKELDFIDESKSIVKFRENNENISPIYAPDVISSLCSVKVLTLEYINGFKINDMKMIEKKGYSNKDIAKKLALSYCKQIFDDGFFHGDPHPGNLLISNGRICFIDFGITGELDEGLKNWLNKAMIAVATGDKNKIVDFILAIGIKRGKVNKGNLYEDVSYLFTTYLNTSLKNIKIAVLLEEMFSIVKNNNIQFPKELAILFRGLVILEGVIAEVDPQLDIISVITSFVKGKNKMLLIKDINEEELVLSAYSFFRDASRIPSKAVEALSSISDGRAKINFNITDLENSVDHISNMVNRLVGALLISSLIIASSLIISNNVGPIYKGISLMGIAGYIISAIFAIFLLIAVVRDGGFRSKKKKRKS
ncbi:MULTISPECIES: lipopolysaccharide core heptose(II) kinase RfaY [Clostridium]|uniref:ABC1 kinase family protein n=1 Tax=Clostridium TaxID=1485 RepID=UPI00290424B7|nr:lipopolysaccharide core heptose(II) kinase RfaY [Clostridium sp.]MDU1824478.1 lipopolysaccharide core heptose(II) kinase RfaY [Clostridium sp.]MDU1841995.1 lipopolysaccharide core heptose(II) kinase RfaY [Clostridium sp.]MDU2691561.1 lipopolysaccharide core heptose(II) kinase RfaY [Clostridium sp.]MDU2957412.1 lipopolysaccharide core heptose(II) kinase RfaY [Clostridium sp.]MDU3108019.1 lipopolysaccharide core heptose(II) kinase RfaY [Clostridium sp.]